MSIVFTPSGSLNVAADSSELPESVGDGGTSSGAMVRCKNLRLNEAGKAKTRDGSTKLNASATSTEIWWIEEQGGTRYTFAGTLIYSNESSIWSGLTSAQWSAIKYNAYNDEQLNVFALNGTDRKRIQNGLVREWGITPPTEAPTFGVGGGSGLTGRYNAKYTYVRKSGSVVVSESDPSDVGEDIQLTNGSLSVMVEETTDPQVTHIRLYRTLANGELYYFDQDILANVSYVYGKTQDWEEFDLDTTAVSLDYEYGYAFDWEEEDEYESGLGYKFSTSDATHSTENVYVWESVYTSEGTLTITFSPTVISETEEASSSHTTTTVIVTPVYALATVSYVWTKVSGDAITIAAPTSSSTAFVADGMEFFETRTAIFRCTATDGTFTDTEDISVTILNMYLNIGPIDPGNG